MYEALQQRCILIEIIIGEKQYSLWYQHKKNRFFTQTALDGVVVSSAVITGIQMLEMSRLGCLIG
jgi:hypothetical protein